MTSKTIFRSLLVISSAVIAIVIGSQHFALERAKVEREADLKKTEIERTAQVEQTKIEEQQATERTEERSQFWQKAIPWGDDEEEENVNE